MRWYKVKALLANVLFDSLEIKMHMGKRYKFGKCYDCFA